MDNIRVSKTADVLSRDEGFESPRKGKLSTRLGNKAAATTTIIEQNLNGREFSGSCQRFKPSNCWILVDGSASEFVYLLFEDLAENVVIQEGSKVSFDIVPGKKKGDTKAGNILVHDEIVEVVQDKEKGKNTKGKGEKKGKEKGGRGKGAKGDAEELKSANVKNAPKRKAVVLSLDPEEEARRAKRAARFGVEYKPLEE